MDVENKVDVIIVGAGPAGVSAGITIARANKKVLIVERGNFAGSKNMFGGAIYEYPTNEIFPDFMNNAPIERINKEYRYIIADDESSVSISYKTNKETSSYTVYRSKWDRWCIEQAVKAGAYFSPQTLVESLIVKENKVIGIKTFREEFYADIVILADGANSILAKQIGLRSAFKPEDFSIGVKEVLKLPKEVIENRFNLQDNTGCVSLIMGGPLKGFTALGYMYTNKDTVSVGLGISLDELGKFKITPYELLDKLKEHNTIGALIKDAETVEYSAHLIPEGGFNKIPKLYSDGVMVVGDAATLINNVHFEGTNIAMLSGKLAGETAIEAINKNDFSKSMLVQYEKKLKESSLYKDIKTFKNVVPFIHGNAKSLLKYYPEKINQFFETYTKSGKEPKYKTYRSFIKTVFKDRNIFQLVKDIINFVKIGIGCLK